MRARVLGSAAGGGFPQWNCGCFQCTAARRGDVSAQPRTQASLAVSGDGRHWILLGASPDVRAQIEAAPTLWPVGQRESPIIGAALPNGDLDAWVGLLSLREWTPLTLYATSVVRRDLVDENAVLRTLDRFPGHSRWVDLVPGARFPVEGGLTIEGVPVPGKPPIHMVGRRAPHPLDNVGFVVRDEQRGSSLAWFPSVARPSPALEQAVSEVDAVFFDGTFHRDDELPATGVGTARASQMGHWPVAGEGGSATLLAGLSARHKWLIHVNNTNPLLTDEGPERTALRELGIEVAYDGLEWER